MNASHGFANTPFNGYNSLTGKLYVPSDLVDSYKVATNWSALYNNGTMEVLPIEGSIYENLDYTALMAPSKNIQEDWL